jgi:hypothetical protein
MCSPLKQKTKAVTTIFPRVLILACIVAPNVKKSAHATSGVQGVPSSLTQGSVTER